MFGSISLLKRQLVLLASLLVVLALAGNLSSAQAAQPDVRLLVDISGSMKKNDPHFLRIPAANLLIDLLPEQSLAGIWTFGAYVNMLVEHGSVTDSWRSNAHNQVQKINSVALFTDIENAIERASWDLNRPNPDTATHLILLSDGLVDTSEAGTPARREAENQTSRDHLLRTLVPKLAKAGYTVHTLALADSADQDLMATMAQRTGGLHAIAYTAEDLMPLLLQIINRLAPKEEVPLDNNRFLIDATIDEFTLLAFHGAGVKATLHDPQGQAFTSSSAAPNQRWHGNSSYTLITVQQPQAGQWHIETPLHPDNRVTVISDIRFNSTNLPSTLYRGYPVTLDTWFSEAGQVIDRREFLSLLQVTAKHKRGEQQLGTFTLPLAANQPYYQLKFDAFEHTGEQTLQIEADGRTFARQLTLAFNVQDIVAASLQLPENGSQPRVILRAQHPDINPAEVSFLINANNQSLTANYRGDGEWTVDLAGLDRSTDQLISLLVQIRRSQQPLSIQLPQLSLKASASPTVTSPVPTAPSISAPSPSAPEPAPITPSVPEPAPIAPSALEPEPTPASSSSEPETTSEPSFDSSLNAKGLFAPIESWDDPRMPWIYLSLGIANILLFLIAFLMYRRFINKRRQLRNQTSSAYPQEPEALADLDDLDSGMDSILDNYEQDSNPNAFDKTQ